VGQSDQPSKARRSVCLCRDSAVADQFQRAHDLGKRGGSVSTLAPIDTKPPIEPLRDLLDTLPRPNDDVQQSLSGRIMDIVVWLRSLGKYNALFRENDMDDAVSLTLTAEDLKELAKRANRFVVTTVTIPRAQWPTVLRLLCPS
jgi:hypothetical protein